MSPANSIALITNALTIPLALFMLILLLWQDYRNSENIFFGVLMAMVVIWSMGVLLARTSAYIGGPDELVNIGMRVLEIGFTGSCVCLYFFTLTLSGSYNRVFVRLVGVSMFLLLVYQGWLAFSIVGPPYEVGPDGSLQYDFSTFGTLLYTGLTLSAIFVAWQRREKIKDNNLLIGIYVFAAGLLIELNVPDLRSKSIGQDFCAVGTLILSFALVRTHIIAPLRGRANQLKAVRDVGLAMTSRIRLEEVLSTIAGQAAEILKAHGAGIFMKQGNVLELAAVHNMPSAFTGHQLAIGEGLAGQVAATGQSTRIEDYRREWSGQPDMPYAKESFGAVVAAPLVFADEVMGVLMVIEGPQGKHFDREDMRLLELLGPQAAVAITNSRLFERQRALTDELETANSKLENVLTSTENPVLALDRHFQIIFANPAATRLLNYGSVTNRSIRDIAPISALPPKPLQALHELQQKRTFTYEVSILGHTYLCQVGLLGYPKPQGYVAVLNDVSQLKEIDRLKNQMIHMTSHDLKNPLAAAMFHVEILQEEGEGILTEEMAKDINTIWTQLTRMNRIISGILDLERIQSGEMFIEDCAIEHLIRTAAQEFESQATRNGITLKVELANDLPTIPGNRHHLMQAFNNVIENAVKFSPNGGQVTIRAGCDNDQVTLDVIDTGIGIAYDDQPRIFEQFFRGTHPGIEPISGSGLGLSLVKAVIDAHQGRVWLESEVNKGTVVHIVLPTSRANAVLEAKGAEV
jgi:signal transduction histidine kinase